MEIDLGGPAAAERLPGPLLKPVSSVQAAKTRRGRRIGMRSASAATSTDATQITDGPTSNPLLRGGVSKDGNPLGRRAGAQAACSSRKDDRMPTYTYEKCLENSYKVNWRIEDVVGGRAFDPARRWLPSRLSGADAISCLNDDEKRQLTHVEMGAYAHLFGFVEEFIAPTISGLAQDFAVDERAGFDALTNFAAEEVKHMNLFRQVRALVDETVGFPLELIGGERDVAHVVMSKNIGAVLLLTAVIEWFTQIHYTEGFADDEAIDPFTKVIFKAHWQEESQHAQMDHLEILRAFGPMSD